MTDKAPTTEPGGTAHIDGGEASFKAGYELGKRHPDKAPTTEPRDRLDDDVLVFAAVLCEDAHTLGYDHGPNPTMVGFDTPYPSCPRHRAMANRLLLAVATRLAAIEGVPR